MQLIDIWARVNLGADSVPRGSCHLWKGSSPSASCSEAGGTWGWMKPMRPARTLCGEQLPEKQDGGSWEEAWWFEVQAVTARAMMLSPLSGVRSPFQEGMGSTGLWTSHPLPPPSPTLLSAWHRAVPGLPRVKVSWYNIENLTVLQHFTLVRILCSYQIKTMWENARLCPSQKYNRWNSFK